MGERPRVQFHFQALRPRRAEIDRLEQAIEPDYIREVVVKISRVDEDAIVPELLPYPDVEPAHFFRLEAQIVAKDLVLAGWRTEPGRIHSQCKIVFVVASL